MLLSRSFGRQNKSQIYIYKYHEEIDNYSSIDVKILELPPMLEQINLDNDYLYLLFESGANKYVNCNEKINVIPKINISSLIE